MSILSIQEACSALVEGKLVIAYLGNNGDYKLNHLAAPVEIRLIGDFFCTYTSHGGVNGRKLRKGEIMKRLHEKFAFLDIHPVCILDKRPVYEPKISR